MKFFVPLFAAGALAASVARDVKTIQSAVSSISDATKALNTAVTAFDGSDLGGVQSATDALLSAISSGDSAVKPSEQITLADALTLQEPIEALGKLTGESVDAVIAKKDTFVGANAGPVVLDQVTKLRDAAKTFADTVTSKVPEAAQPIAADLSAPILAALNRAVEAYADQTGGSPSSSAPAGSSSAAPTPSGSASVPATSATPTVGLPTGTPTATPPPFTGAAMPTAAAGFGAAAMAAMVAVAAL